MKAFSAIALAAALVAAAPLVHAQSSPVEVAAKLKALYPDRPFGPVEKTPIPGLYEVQTGDSLSYVDASGTHIIFGGKMVDFKRQVNLTDQRLGEINKIDPTQLPLADAIKTVKGTGERVIYLFSDPNCPYCKKLETEDLKGVDNVTVYTFLYPILQNSKEKSEQIWCAPKKEKAWADWMERGANPVPTACTNPLDRNLELGRKLRVTGTPTMFAADGRRLSGAVGAQALNSFLDAKKVAAK